jgi:DegV family protein with EDD domain
MSTVTVVTDSTAYIPQELLEKYNIHVVPQVLIWGDETFEDGVDIHPTEFYERLTTAKIMPSTSQVTPKSFIEMWGKLLEEDNQILSILIPNTLSGTVASAIQACENFPGAPIEIVESNMTAMALGFQVLAAAKAAKEGAEMAECKRLAEEARQHTGVVFAVDTLEFLHRGGRIGGGRRFLGTALRIKPILELQDGRIEAVESVRTRKKSLNRIIELVGERINGRQPVHLATLHANAEKDAKEILTMGEEKFNPIESIFSEVSPVIGTHAGPGVVGLAYMAGM